ncbi:hypothetical protein CcCBS67573_g01856 [Chytriomyces confervae]|uniref:Ubiquitin-like domain-containing protein n=1 Tax=Chytriomyces confervae TaxID=246404 RepID=A0A507FKB0_9FUNG|nr:hypothetical protein HDU80_009082 [Chytriomyces hyalinus]TPX76861.1 hypothetical protein CcCBS67573_g01856 [Chytriomyces confervae]
MQSKCEHKVNLVVRFSDRSDISLSLPGNVTVLQLKKGVSVRAGLASKHIRLLFKGRILVDTTEIESLSSSKSETVFIHCAVSDTQNSVETQESQILAPALGFDRLIDIGFSAEEVSNLRSQFHSIRGRDEHNDPTRTAEEAWIDNPQRGETEPDEATSRDPNAEIVLGLCIGFFGGILVLFWIKEQDFFTRRQQLGIIVGMIINICYGLLRFLNS